MDGTFPDGVSNTVILAEKYSQCGAPQGTASGGNVWARWDCADYYQPAFAIWVKPPPADPGAQTMFQVQPEWNTAACDHLRANTSHAAMNAAFADGTVHSFNGGMSPSVWWALLTPNGGESNVDY